MARSMESFTASFPVDFPLIYGLLPFDELSVSFELERSVDRLEFGHEFFVIVEVEVILVMKLVLDLTFVLGFIVGEFDCLLHHNKWII